MAVVKKQKDYVIRICGTEKDLKVLKIALADYANQKHSKTDIHTAEDLLHLISSQEKRQDERREVN